MCRKCLAAVRAVELAISLLNAVSHASDLSGAASNEFHDCFCRMQFVGDESS